MASLVLTPRQPQNLVQVEPDRVLHIHFLGHSAKDQWIRVKIPPAGYLKTRNVAFMAMRRFGYDTADPLYVPPYEVLDARTWKQFPSNWSEEQIDPSINHFLVRLTWSPAYLMLRQAIQYQDHQAIYDAIDMVLFGEPVNIRGQYSHAFVAAMQSLFLQLPPYGQRMLGEAYQVLDTKVYRNV